MPCPGALAPNSVDLTKLCIIMRCRLSEWSGSTATARLYTAYPQGPREFGQFIVASQRGRTSCIHNSLDASTSDMPLSIRPSSLNSLRRTGPRIQMSAEWHCQLTHCGPVHSTLLERYSSSGCARRWSVVSVVVVVCARRLLVGEYAKLIWKRVLAPLGQP